MSEPSRPAPRTDNTEMESPAQLDPTLMRPENAPAPRLGANESIFAPPQIPGDLGTFGRYRVLKKLGQGGMGAVYLGHDTALARRVALKVMRPEYAADPEAHERFLREARAAAVVRSDHVVTIFDVGEERGVPFIAMEYLLGYPLDQFLRSQGNPSLAHVIRIGRETALGLSVAHKLGLIHRDVKPGNIWLEAPRGRVKLLDFGLARGQNDDTHLTDSGLVVGTPAFMSPEQARGLKLDPRSDLFSLGVMLYRLATGKMPFSGDTTMAVLTSLAVDTPTPARQIKPTIPEALEAIIAKLLAKNPADRFQSAREVVEALTEVEAERQKPVAGQGPVEQAPMAISAQTEFIQAELVSEGSESGSSPQVLATTTEPEPTVRKKPGRKKPGRKKPGRGPLAWAAVAAGAVLLAGLAFAAILLWPSKGTLTIESEDPDAEVVVKKDGAVVRDRTKDREFKLKAGSYTVELSGRTDGLKLSAEKVEIVKNGRASVRVTVDRTKTPTGTEGDRKAAEDVIRLGGSVRVKGGAGDYPAAGPLPKDPLVLTRVALSTKPVRDDDLASLRDCKNLTELILDRTGVTDKGLVHFKGCTGLTVLDLGETKISDTGLENFKGCAGLSTLSLHNTPVTDKGLAHFKDCKNFKYLRLSKTLLTDKGLAYFKGCPRLETLVLFETAAGNEGLAHFADCTQMKHLDIHLTEVTGGVLAAFKERKSLAYLFVKNTKIPLVQVAEFSTAVPGCQIECDSATFDGSDRKGAEYALAVGGYVRVEVSGAALEIKPPAELPKEPFALRLANISLNQNVTDAGLGAFAGCKNLRTIFMNSCPLITDAGMAHFKDCPGLHTVRISSTAVTDPGLAHFKGCDLVYLSVEFTRVSDAGLTPFLGKNLTFLDVRKTDVSDQLVREFENRLPRCKVVSNSGTREPKK